MSNIIEIDLDNPGHLFDPPFVDSLFRDVHHNAWTITFIPEDSVSRREKELVTIAENSMDGQRISLRMRRVSKLMGFKVDRIVHSGGGNFSLLSSTGQAQDLADPKGSGELSMNIFQELADISMTAQLAFVTQNAISAQS